MDVLALSETKIKGKGEYQFGDVTGRNLNARVENEEVENVVGKYGVPGQNENGRWLLEMCMEQELVVGNSLFKKREKNKFT
uniref:Uncharacterized protein n=1 Tax=Octopus bimaculoides TaxID=37653 RepID=A0A0L8GJU5_OCTBM